METAPPIQPTLASSLLPSIPESEADRRSQRLGCETQEIDDALRGGVDIGVAGVTCITGDKGTGKTALAFALLATHILHHASNEAVLVDTTGTLDVLRLYNTVLSRLRSNQSHGKSDTGTEDHEAAAERVLSRVKIMRVFDFFGVVEAVSEVRGKLEIQQCERDHQKNQPLHEPTSIGKQRPVQGQESGRKIQRIRSTIPDSDEETEDEDDDIMVVDKPAELSEEHEGIQDDHRTEERVDDGKVGIIVVDNITHAVSPMMKANYVQASALLTSFLRSLSQLTKSHNLGAILINAIATVPKAPPSTGNPPEHSRPHQRNPSSSIFASASHVSPALSPVLPAHADLHLLITQQPLTRQGAVALHSFSSTAPSQAGGSRAERVSVVEVLNDRYGDRVGRWAAFAVGEAGSIIGVDPDRGVPRKQ